jgi:phosphoserine phosphatase RsbU/P
VRIPFKTALRLAFRKLQPRTRVAWFAVYLAGVELLLLALQALLKAAGAVGASASAGAWNTLVLSVLCVLMAFLGLRWFRNYLMWRVRNRLIVTYLFIGGVPVVLIVLMALISGYFLTGQFATFLTFSEIQSRLHELQAANAETAVEMRRSLGSGKAVPAGELKIGDPVFPERRLLLLPETSRPKWLKDTFSGLVLDHGAMYLRAANTVKAGDRSVTVVSSVLIDQDFLAKVATGIGPVTVYVPVKDSRQDVNLEIAAGQGVVVNGNPGKAISAGTLPGPQFPGDGAFGYYALIQPTVWDTGQTAGTPILGTVRISTLFSRLSVSLSLWANIVRILLATLASMFGVIVVIALVIGIRLTRTITKSVANLYEATQHINRGDFSHRIQVKEHDQLGALQTAFNSMTESLEKLIAEQKEKERLQSELEIAHEVQAQLFPSAMSGTPTLELCGVCRPARTVSGDYYDFLSYGSEQMGIAVGDISGKGISAALLMATIHSAVRAYEQEQLVTVSTARRSSLGGGAGSVGLAIHHSPPQSPSQVLWLLNRQLYKTTQPEKYATLFLGFYDGHARQLTYSNAGHLPPLILGQDGSIRKLETGGTVVGLFDNMEYQESTVELCPGDIFVAFSDGVTEPENEFGEFGDDRLIETIEAHRNLPLSRIVDNVLAGVSDWIGSAEQPDDITLVLARPRP